MSKRTVFLGVLVVIIAAITAFLWYQEKGTPEPSSSPVLGGDADEHGCIGSAGYSWCEPKQKCLRIWEEACYESPAQEVQHILAEKYDKDPTDVAITVTKQTDEHMAGMVKFHVPGLPDEPGNSGAFLAVKEGNAWNVVYDGNGSVDCDMLINTYHFPADVLVGFCD